MKMWNTDKIIVRLKASLKSFANAYLLAKLTKKKKNQTTKNIPTQTEINLIYDTISLFCRLYLTCELLYQPRVLNESRLYITPLMPSSV